MDIYLSTCVIGVLAVCFVYFGFYLPAKWKAEKPKSSNVDEYSIGIADDGGFAVVTLSLKLDDGRKAGPFRLVPPYAYQLSDQLCTASARATAGSKVKTENLRDTPHGEPS